MADAFRGLTLRLGADARPLQSAINSITRSAAQAQKQMNRLDKAMKFDGGNAAMMQSKLDLMGDKALHSARAVAKIKTAMQQAVSEARGFDLRKLASQTTAAHNETQKLRDEYNHVDASLQHIWDAVKRAMGANIAGPFKTAEEKAEAAKVAVDNLKEAIHRTGKEGDVARAELKALIETVSNKTGLNNAFGQAKGDADALESTLYKLIESHKRLNAEYEKYEAVQGFRAMKAEAQVFEAEVREAAESTARLRTEMHMLGTGGGLASDLHGIRLLDEYTDKATASARQMIDAYRAMPMSVEAASGKTRAVAAASETLKAKIDAIESALQKVRNDPAFDKQAAASEKAYVEAIKVEQAYAKVKAELDLVDGEADMLKRTLSAMDEGGADKSSEDYRKLKEEIGGTEAKARELRATLNSMDDSHATAALVMQEKELTTQLAAARTQVKALNTEMSLTNRLKNIGNSMREFGFGAYASITPAAMMAGRYMVQAAEDTDAAYRDMAKTVNGTDEELQTLLDHALEFSTTHVTTAEQMLEIESIGGQLGVQVENLEAFAHTVSNLDIATNMEAEDIAVSLGKMATVMNLSVGEYDLFGDALVRLGNNMPALEGDIVTITTRMMGMGKVVGLSADQMLAWSTAATATGQKPYAAGSSLSRFMKNLNSAVAENGESLGKWAKIAGVSSEEFAKAFEEDASGAMYSVVEGMGEMQRNGEDVSGALIDLGIRGVQDTQLLLGLANQMANATSETNVLRDSLMLASDAMSGRDSYYHGRIEQAGDAMREAEKKSEGFSGAIQKMRNQATMLMVELSKGAAPIVSDLGKLFADAAKAVGEMPDSMKTAVVQIGALAAVIGPATVGLSVFLQSFDNIKGLAKTVPSFFANIAGKINPIEASSLRGAKAMGLFRKAFTFLGSTKGMAALTGAGIAIGLVADAVGDYIERQETLKKATEGVVESANRSIRVNYSGREKLDEYSAAAKHAALSSDELAKSTAAMVDRHNEQAEAAEKEIGQLMAAKQAIDKYAGQDLSGNIAAQGELRAAVDLLNQKYGAQIEVIDIVKGKLADESGALVSAGGAVDEYIKKKQDQIRMELLSAQAADQAAQLSVAVNSWTTAQKAADDYYKRNKEILDDIGNRDPESGKAGFFTDYDGLTEEAKRAREQVDKLSEAYDITTRNIGNVMAAQGEYTRSVESSALANQVLYESLDGDELSQFARSLQEAGMTMDEFNNVSYKQWGDAINAWREGGGKVEDVMAALGLSVRTLAEQFGAEMESAGDKFGPVAKTIGKTGDEAASALDKAGISAQQLAKIGSEAFAELYATSGQNLDLVRNKMEALDRAGFAPKDLDVNDDGLLTAKGKVIDFDNLRIGDKVYKVTAEGIEEVKQKADDLAESADEDATMRVEGEAEGFDEAQAEIDETRSAVEEPATMTFDVDMSAVQSALGDLLKNGDVGVDVSIDVTTNGLAEAQSAWSGLKSSAEAGASGTVKVEYGSVTSAKSAVDSLSSAISHVPHKSVDVKANVYGAYAVGKLASAISGLHDKDVTITTTVKKVYKTEHHGSTTSEGGTFASGGVSRFPLIPRNASGGLSGIATSALLTNQGWVGEAGAEALLSMGRQSAIVPLSNRRYVRPFARAVAREMGGGAAQPHVHNTYYLNANAVTDDRVISAVELIVDRASQFQEAM